MSDLVAFLTARLDDAQRRSQPEPERRWSGGWHDSGCATYDYDPSNCDCPLPARVLREVEAKRGMLCFLGQPDMPPGEGRYVAERALFLLATAYSDHPDYRAEWKPT